MLVSSTTTDQRSSHEPAPMQLPSLRPVRTVVLLGTRPSDVLSRRRGIQLSPLLIAPHGDSSVHRHLGDVLIKREVHVTYDTHY